MLVASGTLIYPETQSLRVLPKPLGLATKSRLRAGAMYPCAGTCSPCSVFSTPPQLSQQFHPDLHPGKEGRDTVLGCQDFSWPIWTNTSMGVDKSLEGGGPEVICGFTRLSDNEDG